VPLQQGTGLRRKEKSEAQVASQGARLSRGHEANKVATGPRMVGKGKGDRVETTRSGAGRVSEAQNEQF
jgi:hypothetical protein